MSKDEIIYKNFIDILPNKRKNNGRRTKNQEVDYVESVDGIVEDVPNIFQENFQWDLVRDKDESDVTADNVDNLAQSKRESDTREKSNRLFLVQAVLQYIGCIIVLSLH